MWFCNRKEDPLLLQLCSVSYRSGPSHMHTVACFFLHHCYSADPRTTSKTCDKRAHNLLTHTHTHKHTQSLTRQYCKVCPPFHHLLSLVSFFDNGLLSGRIKHKQRKQLGRLISPFNHEQSHILLLPSPTIEHRGRGDCNANISSTSSEPERTHSGNERWQIEQTYHSSIIRS